MYKRDATAIAAHALKSPEGLVDVIEFTLCTIRQPLQQVIKQRRDIAKNGDKSPFLFGFKRDGWKYTQKNALYLWRVMHDILKRENSDDRKADLIQHFMQIPGLGMVKSAFVVQMVGGGTACLDSHNLKSLGESKNIVTIKKGLKPETVRLKVLDYISLCEQHGDSEYWWNRWCDYVAARRGSPLKSGNEVSAYHVKAVIIQLRKRNE